MRFAFALALLLLAMSAVAQHKSPQVNADHTVAFALNSPNAKKVTVGIEGRASLDMVKGQDGWWTVTTPALEPDIYGYTFSVDGVSFLDPQNPQIKPNLLWLGNMVVVPGKQVWEVQDVPHGSLHRHHYKSATIGDQRDFYVYTPPGYSPSNKKLPVLYLLHGFSDTANGWTSVGMAHVILDNLIFQGKAKPMLVVMPLGYGVPDFASPGSANFRNTQLVSRNYSNFSKALLSEVMPMVEKEYRASPSSKDRAIAGLSMGGAETLFVGLNNVDKFTHVAAFSTGGLGDLNTSFAGLVPDA
ncbi:MAG TPA: alpha/beta hydrolase-fold protein, partial [Fimbriimonas sp.]|nr:alpha/beta hydrolase-fold protein [Fimbriimonas sp.]